MLTSFGDLVHNPFVSSTFAVPDVSTPDAPADLVSLSLSLTPRRSTPET